MKKKKSLAIFFLLGTPYGAQSNKQEITLGAGRVPISSDPDEYMVWFGGQVSVGDWLSEKDWKIQLNQFEKIFFLVISDLK